MTERWVTLTGEAPTTAQAAAVGGVALVKSERIALESGLYVTAPARLQAISAYISDVCRTFSPKHVWARLSCHSSATAAALQGNRHPFTERSPFLGLYGIRRLQAFDDEAEAEMRAMALIHNRHPNVAVLLPLVHDEAQVRWAVSRLRSCGYRGEVGTMVETPAAALEVERLMDAGAAFLLIGLNDLTSLTLGVARYEPTVSHLLDRKHAAVRRLVRHVVGAARVRGVVVGVGGDIDASTEGAYASEGADFIALSPDTLNSR